MSKVISKFATIAFCVLACAGVQAEPLGSAFTYQGQLKQAGCALNGTADLRFTLHDAAESGSQVGSEVVVSGIAVVDGLFTVQLDFGVEVLNGEARWLEVDARIPHDPTDTLPFSMLSPRQALTATPYSLQTKGIYVDPAGKVGVGTTSPDAELEVAGTVHSTSGGFKFPDGTLQATAAAGGGSPWTQTGNDIFYTAGSVGIGNAGPFHLFPAQLPTVSATLPTARALMGCAYSAQTSRIYCIGGIGTGFEPTRSDEIVEYDPSGDTVLVKSSVLPSPTWGLSCSADPISGKVYCFGGLDVDGNALAQIIEYNPASDTISVKSATLPSPRYLLTSAAVSASAKIYCFGGVDDSGGLLDQIVEYDPANDTVTVKSAVLPSPRHSAGCATDASSGKIYCFGGNDINGELSQILEYDPVDDAISVMTSTTPVATSWVAGSSSPLTGNIYCFTSSLNSPLFQYFPYSDTVTKIPVTFPGVGSGISCCHAAVTGKLYVLGDINGGRQIVEFDPTDIPAPTPVQLQIGEPDDGSGAIASRWSVFSSRDFKRSIRPLQQQDYDGILSELKSTEVVRFSYRQDRQNALHLGVIAEDSPAEILGPDGKSVSLADYIAFLHAATKAQQQLIEDKDCRIAELESRVDELESTVYKLVEKVRENER